MHRYLNRLALIPGLILLLLSPGSWADGYKLETLAENLQYPWSIAFLPDGSYLLAGRAGTLHRLRADGSLQPVSGGPETYFAGQGGYFDILPDLDFASNQQLYLSYAHGTPADNGTGIVRATLRGDKLVDSELILLTTPSRDTPQHYGGRMQWLPDRTLLITVGDGFDYREAAQDIGQQLGKVLRINADGSVPADNPFADGAGPARKVYSFGHRNPQGLAYDTANGKIYLHEHGPRGGDEVNLIETGKNYGWPAVTHGVDYTGAYVSPFKEGPGFEPALKVWVPSIAPSGLAFYSSDVFPQWRGSLFVGALVDKEVRRLSLNGQQVVAEEVLFSEIGERIRDIRQGPDGFLYILTDGAEGKLLRVVPATLD